MFYNDKPGKYTVSYCERFLANKKIKNTGTVNWRFLLFVLLLPVRQNKE
jgi:hypothetical protein